MLYGIAVSSRLIRAIRKNRYIVFANYMFKSIKNIISISAKLLFRKIAGRY